MKVKDITKRCVLFISLKLLHVYIASFRQTFKRRINRIIYTALITVTTMNAEIENCYYEGK